MEVVVSRAMGFCFGVQRAMTRIEAEATSGERPVYLLGKLVHNRQAVGRLEELGAHLVDSIGDVPRGAKVVVSTHGMGPQVKEDAREAGLELIDATCPFVARIHRVVAGMARDGFSVFVFGDAGHREVQGILAWAGGAGTVIQSSAEIETLSKKIGLVSQTTKNLDAYRAIVREVADRYIGRISELRVADTICDATAQRQAAAVDLAQQVDVMIVVGGVDSANTKRLGQLCAAVGTPTHLVEDARDIQPEWLVGKDKAGVTAGASTPGWVIDQVVARLRDA